MSASTAVSPLTPPSPPASDSCAKQCGCGNSAIKSYAVPVGITLAAMAGTAAAAAALGCLILLGPAFVPAALVGIVAFFGFSALQLGVGAALLAGIAAVAVLAVIKYKKIQAEEAAVAAKAAADAAAATANAAGNNPPSRTPTPPLPPRTPTPPLPPRTPTPPPASSTSTPPAASSTPTPPLDPLSPAAAAAPPPDDSLSPRPTTTSSAITAAAPKLDTAVAQQAKRKSEDLAAKVRADLAAQEELDAIDEIERAEAAKQLLEDTKISDAAKLAASLDAATTPLNLVPHPSASELASLTTSLNPEEVAQRAAKAAERATKLIFDPRNNPMRQPGDLAFSVQERGVLPEEGSNDAAAAAAAAAPVVNSPRMDKGDVLPGTSSSSSSSSSGSSSSESLDESDSDNDGALGTVTEVATGTDYNTGLDTGA